MIQSKIAVGYKKYGLSHQDYKMIYFVLWAIFLGIISIDESSLSLEGLYLKEVTVPKSYKLIN